MADRSVNGSLRGANMTRITGASEGKPLADPYGQLYGNAFDPPRDPLSHMADPQVVKRDIPITALTGDWTIDGIRSAIAAHKLGQFGTSAMLVDDAFGDDRVQATFGSRTGALFGSPVKHKQAKADADGACLRDWKAQWASIAAQNVLAEIKRWAIMMGFGVAELLWDTSVTPWRCYLKPWHPRYIYYRWDIRRLVANTLDGPEVIEPGNGKWFVHAPFGLYRGWIHGAIRPIGEKWMIKQLAWRDWARFNERHGLPIIKAYVPAAGDPRQKAAFVQSMATMGQEAVVGLPQNVDETGYDLDLMEARDRGSDTFGKTIEAADRAIILTIKSQNLTTEISEGSFAAARQHGNTEQVTLQFDANVFSHDLHTQVGRPFAMLNHGDAAKAPKSTWDVKPIEDRAAEAKTLLDASSALKQFKEAGVPVDVKRYAKKFKLPLDPNAKESEASGPAIFAYHIDGGIVTKNEVRATLGLPKRDDGDVLTGEDNANEAGDGSKQAGARSVRRRDESRSAARAAPRGDRGRVQEAAGRGSGHHRQRRGGVVR